MFVPSNSLAKLKALLVLAHTLGFSTHAEPMRELTVLAPALWSVHWLGCVVGRPWTSILVRTGVFRRPAGENDPDHPADFVVQDVLQAVEAALHRTRHSRWHSMR